MYTLVAVDCTTLLILVILSYQLASYLVLECGFPILLGFNYMLARRRLRKEDALVREDDGQPPSDVFWLYTGATGYFAGTLYGLLCILVGKFPVASLPVLLVPFLLGLHFLRAARKIRSRKLE